jgi:hypothetical protein
LLGSWGVCTTTSLTNENKGVCHTVALLAIYIKTNVKAKEELWKLKYFIMPKYNLPKIL